MRVFDIDADARLLIGLGDELAEIDTSTGARTRLLATPGLSAARYLPGERPSDRSVVVQHDSPPRLSLLLVRKRRMRPMVRATDRACELLEALPGRVVYRTNQRARLEFDVVIRNAFVGEEQTVFTGGEVRTAAVSPDSRFVAVRLADELVLVATMPETADDHVRRLGGEDPAGGHVNPCWLPDSTRLIATEVHAEHADVVRYDVAANRWSTVLGGLAPGSIALPSPDGTLLAVLGEQLISLHSADSGEPLREVPLPAPAVADQVRWAPDSAAIGLSTSDGAHLITAARGHLRTFT